MIIILPFPPEPPKSPSDYPMYKRDLQRWSRLCGFDPAIQGDIVLDNISWDHPLKMKLENAVGSKVSNNKRGISEILKYLDGRYELYLLCNMSRAKGESILAFVNEWEGRLRAVGRSGVVPYQVHGEDLLYSCKLIKEDRKLIKSDLKKEGLSCNCKNVIQVIRRACHHDTLKTEIHEKLQMMNTGRVGDCCQIL